MVSKTAKPSLLVVDDEESIRELLVIMLKREGYDVETAVDGESAASVLTKRGFDAVITDIAMPGISGIELLAKVRAQSFDTAVIVMTAHGSTESAVEAMKLGASDYLTKPFQIDEMKIAVANALKVRAMERENRQLRTELGKSFSVSNIIGNAASMQPVFEMIKRVSETKTNIMILGESGTGKELVAHAIHRNSADPAAPFVVINCAAVPETLFESELFGHKRGSFTGAVADKEGIFEQANGGSLFLDEVGDIPLPIQVKLLRAIQQKSFRPVGALEDVTVDVRILCATNKNLEEMTTKGQFREDLFYRLNVIQIRMPSLRERREDIPALAEHFLSKFAVTMGKPVKSFSKEAMRMLQNYDFPGNVRELENLVERAVALETQSVILPESLPQKLLMQRDAAAAMPAAPTAEKTKAIEPSGPFDLEQGVEDFEKAHIVRALEKSNGVKKRAAALLGISFRSLRYRIEKYGIDDPNPEEKE
ncbi:MAG: sigma-54-dependent transcriptional regulator [Bdellovibrionota bacterium]